ncbi:7369_t:CDS:2, partial [Ambispora leptoticha]
SLYDFITPCNNLMFFCALNYPEELPDFIRDRFTMIEIEPPSYQQRIEILREELLKKALTKTLSIRGAKDNIANLINRMRVDFLIPEKTLPSDVVNYN